MEMIVLIALKPLLEIARAADAMDLVLWLFLGGFFYIAGAVIYAMARREFVHTIFHLFILLGLTSHIWVAWLIPL